MDRLRQLILDTQDIKQFVGDIISAAPEKVVCRPLHLQATGVMGIGMSPYTQMFVPMLYIHMYESCRKALLVLGWVPSNEALKSLITFIEGALQSLWQLAPSAEAHGTHPLGTLEVLNTHWMCSDVCVRYLQET
jgi:hypothetical protein